MMTGDSRFDRITAISLVLIALSAFAMVALLVADQERGPSTGGPGVERVEEIDWGAAAGGRHAMGPGYAEVTIVEFSDYDCEACRHWRVHLRAVMARHEGAVRVVYRHLPSGRNRYSWHGANAAECAGTQARFWEYDALLHAHPHWFIDDLVGFAKSAGVPDMDVFEACVQHQERLVEVEADVALAGRLSARPRPRPVVLVNGVRLAPPLDSLALEARAVRSSASQSCHEPGRSAHRGLDGGRAVGALWSA